jgi:penicillin-binding protein 1C
MRRARSTAAGAAIAVAVAGAWWTASSPRSVPAFATVVAEWVPSDAVLLDRHGEAIDRERMDYQVRRGEWTPLDAVSPALRAAIVDGEDRRFWRHAGVDGAALLAAVRDRGFSQRRRGASTITMQVAALLDPRVRAGSSGGAWRRKIAQMRMARALESRWSKPQILEAYLNLLGFRGELQGIGAASQVLAGKAPSGLSLPESLVLAALLPAPRASSDRVAQRACARATARSVQGGRLESRPTRSEPQASEGGPLHGMADCAPIRAAAAAMLERYARGAGQPAEHLAPQLARALLREPGARVRTTLDAGVQRLAVDALTGHLAGLASRNVRDGAALVVDNDTGDVLAYVGSAGRTSRAREVDGVRARRQAGSTLKPFLYELALERDYLTAASLLDDSPIALDTRSGIYLPQNYDRDFKGLVSVRTALASSLNVPAVRALMLVGVEAFRDRLHALGYRGITQPGDFYGYSLALGSAEVSLWEQVSAYRALARGGRWSPIRTQPDTPTPADARLAEDASFIVSDILSDRAARALTFGLDSVLSTPFWSAVKTGTSVDMRDNWCVGFSRRFTVGVWVGNFEGDSMHDVSGVTGAAPVWQEIMEALHARVPSRPPPAPTGVVAARARFDPAVEPPRDEWFRRTRDAAPVRTVAVAEEIARIASPANGMVIAVDPDIPGRFQRVPLSARGAGEGMVLRLNGAAIGPAHQAVMWMPQRGAYLLALEDAAGRTIDAARFIVR